MALTINIQNLGEALGANCWGLWYIWEAIWSPFWAHLQAQQYYLHYFLANVTLLAAKKGLNAILSDPMGHTVDIQ